MKPLALVASGMATGVGPTSAATCAAIRAGINGFVETQFVDQGGEVLAGCPVPCETPVRGVDKLAQLANSALAECVTETKDTGLILCSPESDRPGRLTLDRLPDFSRFQVLPKGRVSVAEALRFAAEWIHEEKMPRCVILGVDTLLVGKSLAAYEGRQRLLTSQNSDGFVPGEAAAAILVEAPRNESDLLCVGLGFGEEKATVDSEDPLRADGMVAAVRAALVDAGKSMADIDYRIADVSGGLYGFKEAALVVGRTLRTRKLALPIWHPADCVGEVGAAIGPLVLGVALAAARKGYAPGARVLCHFSNDDGARAAIVLEDRRG